MLVNEFEVINDKLDIIAQALVNGGIMTEKEHNKIQELNKKRSELIYAEETCEGNN